MKIGNLLVYLRDLLEKKLKLLIKKPPNFREEKPKWDLVWPEIREDQDSIFLEHLQVLLTLAGRFYLYFIIKSFIEGLIISLSISNMKSIGDKVVVDFFECSL